MERKQPPAPTLPAYLAQKQRLRRSRHKTHEEQKAAERVISSGDYSCAAEDLSPIAQREPGRLQPHCSTADRRPSQCCHATVPKVSQTHLLPRSIPGVCGLWSYKVQVRSFGVGLERT